MKRIWLTSLFKDEAVVQPVIAKLKQYGLEVGGHFWEDNLEKMAWIEAREELIKETTGTWIILARGNELAQESIRYGLSLLMISVRAQQGTRFPVFILAAGGTLEPGILPAAFGGCPLLASDSASFPAKIVAGLHATKPATAPVDYRIDVYGNPQIGQWFEIGPAGSTWQGALFGISDGKVLFHAVGPKGRLPERTVLNYPLRDMKIRLHDQNFTVWAVQNPLTENDSYFVKVEGSPAHCIFGPYSDRDETEVYSLRLK